MSDQPDIPSKGPSSTFRQQAERRVKALQVEGLDHDPQKLLHELQVHQIELEMQNEALRETQAELEAALARSSNLFDFAPIPYLTTDANSKIIQANHAAAELFNESRRNLCQMNLQQFISVEDAPHFKDLLLKAAASGLRETREIKLSISGQVAWVELNLLIELPQNTCLIALEDITKRTVAEQKLKLAAYRYDDMLKANKDGFWLVDGSTGKLLDVNEAAVAMLGYTRDELLSRRILDLDALYKADTYELKMRQIMSEGWGVFETQHRTKDGRIIDVEVSTLPEKTSSCLVAFIRDITQRKAMERDLRRLSLAVDQTVESVLITDLNARIEYVNEAFLRKTGYPRDEVLGQNPHFLSAGKTPQATYDDLWVKLGRGEPWQGEFINRRKDGSEFYEWASVSPVHEPDGTVSAYVAVKLDITDRKKVEANLIAAKQAAESANAAKSQFLAHMSHELRTPMNAILGFAQILERDELHPDQLEMVGMIREAGNSLLHIINDILDLSKLEAGQLALEEKPFCLSAVLERVREFYRHGAENKGLTLRFDPLPESMRGLQGDIHRLEQVLTNLVGNAIKFTAQGEISVRVTPLAMTESTARLRFEIKDTGIGIDEMTLARLFQPFSQGDSSITRRYGGTGLGLSISKQLVEQMGGEIGVSSQKGQGATFWFEIPFKCAPKAPLLKSDEVPRATSTEKPKLMGLRVLAVDDSAMNLRMLERILILQGALVTLASDGQEALDKLRAGPKSFDVVLMDIQMPVMDGISTTREIRRDSELSKLPIIALTAGVLPEEREAAISAGMNDFLAKPLDLGQMNKVLSQYVAG